MLEKLFRYLNYAIILIINFNIFFFLIYSLRNDLQRIGSSSKEEIVEFEYDLIKRCILYSGSYINKGINKTFSDKEMLWGWIALYP